jgi:hypothetical protein
MTTRLARSLRRSMQAFIDRRFYRERYGTEKTLETFGVRLRDEVYLNAITDDLVGVVPNTTQPVHASHWLRAPELGSEDPRARL